MFFIWREGNTAERIACNSSIASRCNNFTRHTTFQVTTNVRQVLNERSKRLYPNQIIGTDLIGFDWHTHKSLHTAKKEKKKRTLEERARERDEMGADYSLLTKISTKTKALRWFTAIIPSYWIWCATQASFVFVFVSIAKKCLRFYNYITLMRRIMNGLEFNIMYKYKVTTYIN